MGIAVRSGWVTPSLARGLVARPRSRFAVAGITVEISGETSQSVDLGPQLAPFAVDTAGLEDIALQVEWSSLSGPVRGRELFHSGGLWNVCESGDGLVFDFITDHLGPRPYKRLLVDRDFTHARVLLNQESLTAADAGRALEYPLDELLITHFLSLGRGVELHACGLVREDGQSFLFVGHSGAGKSTTTRLWKRHSPVEVLSDDRIIVRREIASALPTLSGQESHSFFMHGTPWHGEAAFASPLRAPLRRIFLLEHGPSNHVERISPSTAVAELLARSFTPFYDRRFVDPVLTLLEEIAESLPCYRFQFVPEQSAVEKILEFCD